MIKRFLEDKILKVLDNFKIVYLAGARQTGKSTLVRHIGEKLGYKYVSLDDDDDRNLAINDPAQFFEIYNTPLIIDEIQKAPQIINRIKQIVDNSPQNGQFILTGSANLFANPRLQDTLTGRIAVLKLYPFSVFELKSNEFNLVKALFDKTITSALQKYECANIKTIAQRLYTGLYPAVINLDKEFLGLWFENYIKTRLLSEIDALTERDLRKHQALEQLFYLLAGQNANLLNIANIAKDLKIHYQTAKAYLYFLEQIFTIERLQPFYSNISKQVLKTPKIYFTDTGLASYLSRPNLNLLMQKKENFGGLLENFIYLELRKHSSFLLDTPKIYFFRGPNRQYEIDFILENSDNELIAIEVKAGSNITPADLKGMKYFADKHKVKHLYVFYGGQKLSALQLNGHTVYLLPYCKLF